VTKRGRVKRADLGIRNERIWGALDILDAERYVSVFQDAQIEGEKRKKRTRKRIRLAADPRQYGMKQVYLEGWGGHPGDSSPNQVEPEKLYALMDWATAGVNRGKEIENSYADSLCRG